MFSMKKYQLNPEIPDDTDASAEWNRDGRLLSEELLTAHVTRFKSSAFRQLRRRT